MPTGKNTTVAKQCGLSNQKMFVMEYILIFQEGDREVIKTYVESFREETPAELVDLYNRKPGSRFRF